MALIPWWIKYPNVNDEVLNLDWLLKKMQENDEKIANFINLNTIKYANPILWDITSQYEANTVVVDPQTGDAYISVAPVPVGVILSNTDYWTKIYNYADALHVLRKQIADADEELSPTATAARTPGNLVWLDGYLYMVTAAMNAGDAYVVGSNIGKVTIEQIINSISTSIGDLANLNTSDKTSVVNALNEAYALALADMTNIGNLPSLNTTDKTSLVNAINEVYADVHPSYKRVLTVGAAGCDYNTINAAVTAAKLYSTSTARTAILITSGTYDEEITLNGNGIDLIGLGMPRITHNSTYPNAPVYVVGDCNVSNIYFLCTGNSYAVHYEGQTNPDIVLAEVSFTNCIFVATNQSALGMGMGDGLTARFFNCVFVCNTASAYPVYIHNNPNGADYVQSAEFYNCTLKSSNQNALLCDNARAMQGGGILSPMSLMFAGCVGGVSKNQIIYRADNLNTLHYIPESGEIQLALQSTNNDILGVNYNERYFNLTRHVAIASTPDYGTGTVKIDFLTNFPVQSYYRRLNSVMINGMDYTSSFTIESITDNCITLVTTYTAIDGYYATINIEFSLQDFT